MAIICGSFGLGITRQGVSLLNKSSRHLQPPTCHQKYSIFLHVCHKSAKRTASVFKKRVSYIQIPNFYQDHNQSS